MELLQEMVPTALTQVDLPVPELVTCLSSCLEAEAVALLCVDACQNDPDARALRAAQRLLEDAADMCACVMRVLCRGGQPDPSALRALLEGCAAQCRSAAASCAEHAGSHPPCALAARACDASGRACAALLEALLEAPTA